VCADPVVSKPKLQAGFSHREIELMVRDNPAQVLGAAQPVGA
jgi:hypothetical protein